MLEHVIINDVGSYPLPNDSGKVSITEVSTDMLKLINRATITPAYSALTESDRLRQYFRIHENPGDTHCDLNKLLNGSYSIGYPTAGDKLLKMGGEIPSKLFGIMRDHEIATENRSLIPVIGKGSNVVLVLGLLTGAEIMVSMETNRIGLIRIEK